MTSPFVWVVHRWDCGYGGDDDRKILAVCTSLEAAREIARSAERPDDVKVEAFPLDRAALHA